ncbi:MAG: FkbM family methyltransferase [Verrucomicrobia bacterium]|nr:FkbM family methyltransferase [Verrucomicrobiota bacterium]
MHIYGRRDLVMYMSLFLIDEYDSDVWQAQLAEAYNPLILDVGANLGMFSALCLSFNPSCRPRCFELIPEAEAVILKRLQTAGCHDEIVTIGAVGQEHGCVTEIRYDAPFASTNRVGQTQGTHSANIPCVAIDQWWKEHYGEIEPNIFLAKIDVEGAEIDVIRGGTKVVTSAQIILIECHESRNALDLLTETHEIIRDEIYAENYWICILRKRKAGVST